MTPCSLVPESLFFCGREDSEQRKSDSGGARKVPCMYFNERKDSISLKIFMREVHGRLKVPAELGFRGAQVANGSTIILRIESTNPQSVVCKIRLPYVMVQ